MSRVSRSNTEDRSQLLVLLRRAESLLDEAVRRAGERVVPGDAGTTTQAELRESLDQTLARLEFAAQREPTEARRHGSRLNRVRGRHALHARRMPQGALDGLYEAVRAEAAGERGWMRSGMSGAFLDAPRSLVLWRRTAMAACLLLAVGAGMMLNERPLTNPGDLGGVRAGFDPRDELLSLRSGAERAPGSADGAIVPTSGGPRSMTPGSMTPGSRMPGSTGTGSRAAGRRIMQRAGTPLVWGLSNRAEQGSRRMLDSVQIFPVPNRAAGDVEQN